MGKEVIFDKDKLYLYASADGVTRLRCGRHVHTEVWGRPQRIWRVLKLGWRSCVECEWERREGIHLAEPEDEKEP